MSSDSNKIVNFINSLFKNKDFAEFYYKLNTNEFHYNFHDVYTFEQFWDLVREIRNLKISTSVLTQFQKCLTGNNFSGNLSVYPKLSEERSRLLIEKLLAGNPPMSETKRVQSFEVMTEKIQQADHTTRLNQLWHLDLKKLLITAMDSINSNQKTTHKPHETKSFLSAQHFQKLIVRLHMDESLDLNKIQNIAKDMRQSLRQIYKNQKVIKGQLNILSEAEMITLYLKKYLPENTETKKWIRSFSKCVLSLQKSYIKKKLFVPRRFELTFLDKNLDMYRALRFSDATRNCLNSNLKNVLPVGINNLSLKQKPAVLINKIIVLFSYFLYGLSPMKSLAKLYKDPLVFIADVKDLEINKIVGFVFGRMAVHSLTGRSLVMLNNVYVPENIHQVTPKIISIIEKFIGTPIHAEAIVLPAIHSEFVSPLEGFQIKTIDMVPYVALNNIFGLPLNKNHDDYSFLPYRVNRSIRMKVKYKTID